MRRVRSHRVPADDRSSVVQPGLIRRRDSSTSAAGSGEIYLGAPHTTAPLDQHQHAKRVGAGLGLVSEYLIPATRQSHTDYFEYHHVLRYGLRQRAVGTGAVELYRRKLEMEGSVGNTQF